MALAEAIRDALGDRSQSWLASEVGVDDARLSRILNGKVDAKAITLEFVVAVEDALELGRGDLLRAAGYVDGAVTLTAAVVSDPSLSPPQRRALRGLIQSWKG